MRRLTFRRSALVGVAVALLWSAHTPKSTLGVGVCHPVIDHFEITQSTQHDSCETTPCFVGDAPPLNYEPPEPSIPILAKRSTAIRMYVKTSTACNQNLLYDVTGSLYIGLGMATLPGLSANNRSITVHQPGWNRENPSDSLTFILGPGLMNWGDAMDIVGLIDTYSTTQNGSMISCGSSQGCLPYRQHIELNHRPSHTMMTMPVRYQPGGPGTLIGLPDQVDQDTADAMLWAMWPLPDNARTYAIHKAPAGGVFDPVKYDLDTSDDILFFDDLALERAGTQMPGTGGPPDYLYALFRGRPFANRYGAAVIKDQVGFGNSEEDRTQKTFSHEVGAHLTYGMEDLPAAVDYLETDEVGFDVLRRVEGFPSSIRNRNLQDVLVPSYNNLQTWIMPQRYLDAYNFVAPTAPPPSFMSFYAIGGWADAGASRGELRPTIELSNKITPTVSEPGDGSLRLVDNVGNVLSETSFPIAASGSSPVTALLPASAEVYAIELYANNVLLDSIKRTSSSPTVIITSPTAGEVLTAQTIVRWEASDMDAGDELRAYVQFSHDGGASWMPLSPRVQGTQELAFPFDAVPSATDGIVRVLVSDGLNTTSAEVGGLSVSPNRLPQTSLASPPDGTQHWAGSNLVLQGSSYDPEDGFLDDAALVWTDLSGGQSSYLGSGSSLDISTLTAGTHVITLTATDSAGATSARSTTVHVLP